VLTFLADLTPAAAVSLGLIPVGVIGFVLAFAPANAAYFDPRRADEVALALPLLIAVGPRWFAIRETALDAAALLILLTTSPKGAMS